VKIRLGTVSSVPSAGIIRIRLHGLAKSPLSLLGTPTEWLDDMPAFADIQGLMPAGVRWPLKLMPAKPKSSSFFTWTEMMTETTDVHQVPFGVLLRRWRARRQLTQTDLAVSMESSTRHLSCLETGKARPGREMVARIAEYLDLPLRERNALLLSAGFAPAFAERPLGALEAAKIAIDRVLAAHSPFPAFAVDRHWNVVLSNGALPQLYEGCSPELLRAPINAMRLILHPDGMGPRIVNFSAWRAHSQSVLRQQLQTRVDPLTRALLAEISAYPVPINSEPYGGLEAEEHLATPWRVATRFGGRVLPEYYDRLRHAK
jgi:transcriptional regulator with XRE-family HTH domain